MDKKLLSVFCASALLFSASALRAQEEDLLPPPPPPGHEMDHPGPRPDHMRKGPKFDKEMHKKMAEKLAKDLNLTDDQQKKAEEIREAGRKKVEPLFKQMDELRKKMDQLREENMKEFESILTPDQKAKLEKIKAEHDKRRAERMDRPVRHKGPRHDKKADK